MSNLQNNELHFSGWQALLGLGANLLLALLVAIPYMHKIL
jgi:hypothetical protein